MEVSFRCIYQGIDVICFNLNCILSYKVESSNKEATVAERTFKLPGIQKFIEDNAPNYIDEFQVI